MNKLQKLNHSRAISICIFKNKSFSFGYPGRVFELEANNEKDKFNWITALTELRNEIVKIKTGGYLQESDMELIKSRGRGDSTVKKWKANNIDKSTMEVKSFAICRANFKLVYIFKYCNSEKLKLLNFRKNYLIRN